MVKLPCTETEKMIELKGKILSLKALNSTDDIKHLFDNYVTWKE